MEKSYKYLVILLIIFTFILIYKVHFNYPYFYQDPHNKNFIVEEKAGKYDYPIHGDEWTHLAQTEYIIKNKEIPKTNPYLKDSGNKLDLESGFQVFNAQFSILTNLDLILNYKYLPAIFSIIYILCLIIFILLITKNFYISIFSSLFFLSVKNNVNLMGIWFLVPITFSIFLIYLFFYCFLNENKKLNYLSILFYITSIFVYPISTILITFALLIYSIFYKKFSKYYLILLFTLVISSLILFRNNLDKIFSIILFKYGWTGAFEFNYSITKMFGLIASAFALFGIFQVYKKKLNKILIILPLVCLIPILTYLMFKFTLFIPYQRAFLYLLINLAPLAGIGLYYLSENIYNFLNKIDKSAAIFIVVLFTLLVFINNFYNYYKIDNNQFLMLHFINDDDYNALKFVKDNYRGNNLIMTNLLTAFAVYPVTQNQVVALPLSNLGGGNEKLINKFYASNCDMKKNIVENNNINLVYSYNKINCDFLKEVYNKNAYVYSIQKNNA
jgi:hypothetical protein